MTRRQPEQANQRGRLLPRFGARQRLVAGLLALISVVTACTDDGRSRVDDALENISSAQPADDQRDAAPAEAAPEEAASEEPPPETTTAPPAEPPPADTAPTGPAPGSEGLSTEDWFLLLTLGMAVVSIIVIALAVASRRSQATTEHRAALHSRLREVVGQSRWIHDAGSVEVLLATDPEQLTRVWNELRTRMVDLESRIATLAASTGEVSLDRDLRHLAQCVADLRNAEEAYVTTGSRVRGNHADLTRTANQTVADYRLRLQAAIERVADAMRI